MTAYSLAVCSPFTVTSEASRERTRERRSRKGAGLLPSPPPPLALTPPLSTAPSLLLATPPNEELTQSQASSGPELTFYVHRCPRNPKWGGKGAAEVRLVMSVYRLFTVPYFSVRSSRPSALRYVRLIWMSFKST